MQIQKVKNNNLNFGAKLIINKPNEISSNALTKLKNKAKEIGYKDDVIEITLNKAEELKIEKENRTVYTRRTIIGEVLSLPNKLRDKRTMRCSAFGNISIQESTEKTIDEYLDILSKIL